MAFKMRTSKPKAGNKYYITKANGGYSDAIKGSPTDKDCDVQLCWVRLWAIQ